MGQRPAAVETLSQWRDETPPVPIWMLTPQICEGSQFLDCDGYPFHGVSKINAYV